MLKILRNIFLPIGFCIVFLVGCNVGWSRPGTTEGEFYQDRYECQQQSAQMYPVSMVRRTIGVGYQPAAITSCNSYGGNTQCATSGGNYVPPASINEDANLDNRNAAFRSCLNAKGYAFKMEFKK